MADLVCLIEGFETKLPDIGTRSVTQFGRHLRCRALTRVP